jgi:glycosyltransferase involved in cell wall biosynthesis
LTKKNNTFDLTIFVPAYNEEKYIIGTLRKIYLSNTYFNKKVEIIIIDDFSHDKTSFLVKEFKKKNINNNITLIKNKRNLGVSNNFKQALKIARGRYFRMVCGDDIDFVKTHKLVLKNIDKFDIINPTYEYVEGKSISRMALSVLFTFIVNTIFGKKLKYYNGTVAYKTNKLKKIRDINSGFGFQAHITCQLLMNNCTIKELLCNAKHREKSNAISLKNLYLAFILFLKLIHLRITK